MRLVVPVIGAGTQDDPRRVNLPTWTLVEVSADGTTAVVDVPDDCLPPGLVVPPAVGTPAQASGRDLARASRVQLTRLYQFLDERYAEHRGRFRPVANG